MSSGTTVPSAGASAGKAGRSSRNAIVAVVIVIVIIAAGAAAYVLTRPSSSSQKYITVGTLYASSGSFALSSGFQLAGLKLWINQTNANGGLYLSSMGKKLPLKLITLDDQSSTTTATTEYTNLITVDHVNILVADFGSTLTAPAVAIAQEHHVLLFDPTASSPGYFTSNNPYIVDLSIRVSSEWPLVLANYLISQKANITRVATIYLDQAFTTAQAYTFNKAIQTAGMSLVFNQSVSSTTGTTSGYSTLLQTVNASNPQAVINFGYDTNDIAFFSALQADNMHFNFVFSIYAGLEFSLLQKDAPAGSLNYTYTYASPPNVEYSNNTIGPTTAAFVSQWEANHSGAAPNFNNIAGYNAGLLIGDMITKAGTLNETALRAAANATSGTTTTLEGPFLIDKTTGAQHGMPMDVLQYQPTSTGLKPVVLYPFSVATGTAVYPAPSVVVSSAQVSSHSALPAAPSQYASTAAAASAFASLLVYDPLLSTAGVSRSE